MNRNRIPLKSTFIPIMLFVFVCINACAEIRLGTIPTPPPDAKLRVFIMPVSGDPPRGGFWGTPHEQFRNNMYHSISRFLNDTGIYEVIPDEDTRAVLGTNEFMGWQWLKDDLQTMR
jgi:hypothetical protein